MEEVLTWIAFGTSITALVVALASLALSPRRERRSPNAGR